MSWRYHTQVCFPATEAVVINHKAPPRCSSSFVARRKDVSCKTSNLVIKKRIYISSGHCSSSLIQIEIWICLLSNFFSALQHRSFWKNLLFLYFYNFYPWETDCYTASPFLVKSISSCPFPFHLCKKTKQNKKPNNSKFLLIVPFLYLLCSSWKWIVDTMKMGKIRC